MITGLTLKNWRSHLESRFDFDVGTNALVGIIGSGKSSVLDAICFALFGTFPNLQMRRIKLDDIIMKKPLTKERAEVEVTFNANGNTYFVKRVIEKGRGTTSSELRENGRVVESPSTARVTEFIEKILKVNYDLFTKAIYSEQNSIDYFLTIPRGQRMKKIDELLMIDKFEKARSAAVSLINKVNDKKSGKQSFIESINVEELKKTSNDIKGIIDKAWSEKTYLEKQMSELKAYKESKEKEYQESRLLKEDLEKSKVLEKAITSRLEDSYMFIQKMEPAMSNMDGDSLSSGLRNLDRYLSELQSLWKDEQKRYERLQDQFAKAKAEADFIRKEKIEKLEAELERKLAMQKQLERSKPGLNKDVEKDIESKKKTIEKLVAEIEFMNIKIRDLQEVMDDLSSVEGKCPVCESKITQEKKIVLIKKKAFQIEQMKEKIIEAGKKKTVTEDEMKSLEQMAETLHEMLDEIKDIDNIKSELENGRNIYSVLNESSAKLEAELKSIRDSVEKMQSKMRDTESQKQKAEMIMSQMREYIERKQLIDSLIKSRNEAVIHIKTIEQSLLGKDLLRMEAEMKNINTKERDMAVAIGTIDQMIKEKQGRLSDISTLVSNAEKTMEEVKKLDKTIHQLKIFEKALEATQTQLRKEFVTSVNLTMESLWPNLYPYKDFTGIRLYVEDDDYILQLQEKSGKRTNVEGFASGGERSIAALTLRIAFALVLAPQLRWLVLDEPTHNLDAKSVEDLATALGESIGNFIDQIFLITHDEKLENAVTGYAYRLHRDKANEQETKITRV